MDKSKAWIIMTEVDFDAAEQVMQNFYDWLGMRAILMLNLREMADKLERTMNKV